MVRLRTHTSGVGEHDAVWWVNDRRSFSDILHAWIEKLGSVDRIFKETCLDAGDMSADLFLALAGGMMRPSRYMALYLAAVVPPDVASKTVLDNRGLSAARSRRPEAQFGFQDLVPCRVAYVEQIFHASRKQRKSDNLIEFLGARLHDVAKRRGHPEPELEPSLQTLASFCEVSVEQLTGRKAIAHEDTRYHCVKVGAAMLGLDGADEEEFALLLAGSEEAGNGLDRPPLCRALSFARRSMGLHPRDVGAAVGQTANSIARYEYGVYAPTDSTLNAISCVTKLEPSTVELLHGGLRELRAYVAQTPAFSQLFSELVTRFGGMEAFKRESGLRRFFPDATLQQIADGELVPSVRVGGCMWFGLEQRVSVSSHQWRKSLHVATVFAEATCDFPDQGRRSFAEFRTRTIERLAAQGAASRLFRFLQLANDRTVQDLSDELGLRIHFVKELTRTEPRSTPTTADLHAIGLVYGLTDYERMLVGHAIVRNLAQRFKGPAGNRLRADLTTLLGHHPEQRIIPLSRRSAPDTDAIIAENLNLLRTMVEDGFLQGFDIEGAINPWPLVMCRLRAERGISQERAVTLLRGRTFSTTNWSSFESGRARPTVTQQHDILQSFGIDWRMGMSRTLTGANGNEAVLEPASANVRDFRFPTTL